MLNVFTFPEYLWKEGVKEGEGRGAELNFCSGGGKTLIKLNSEALLVIWPRVRTSGF